MINPKYAVKCLKLGFLRYQRYRKLPITIDVSKNTISFYAKNRTMEKGKNARVSNHHLSMGRFAEKNEPWLCDNISIVFIVPGSPQDKRLRPRLYQNAEGSYKEFDVTTYPYNPDLLEPNDISAIFQAIAKYLESGVYDDPFKGTDKEATPMPRHSNIKPYKGRTKKLGEGIARLDNALLNEIGQFCVSQYLLLNEYNQNNYKRNMRNKKVVRLTESQLHNIIAESVSQILNESLEEGSLMNGVRNMAGKVYGAYQGAKTGYSHGGSKMANRNDHINRTENGANFLDSHNQMKKSDAISDVGHVLEYMGRMGIYPSEDFVQRFVKAIQSQGGQGHMKDYWKNSQW